MKMTLRGLMSFVNLLCFYVLLFQIFSVSVSFVEIKLSRRERKRKREKGGKRNLKKITEQKKAGFHFKLFGKNKRKQKIGEGFFKKLNKNEVDAERMWLRKCGNCF